MGASSAHSAALLPAALLTDGTARPNRETVELGSNPYFRYRIPSRAGPRTTIYTQPSTAGVLVGICRAGPEHANSITSGCEQTLATVRRSAGRPLPPVGAELYLASLATALRSFYGERKEQARALAVATDAHSQAVAAAWLATASDRAARRLAKTAPEQLEKPTNMALVSALKRMKTGYSDMASGARTGQRTVYDNGRAKVSAGVASFDAIVESLNEGG